MSTIRRSGVKAKGVLAGEKITVGRLGTGGQTAPVEPAARVPRILALMPIRQTVIFPGTVMPLNIGRPRSRRLLNDLLPDEKIVGLVAQRKADQEEPAVEDLYGVGTAAMVLKLLKVEEGGQVAIVHGLSRFRIEKVTQTDPFYRAEVSPVIETDAAGPEVDVLVANLRDMAGRVFEIAPNVPEEARAVLANLEKPSALADFLAANMPLEAPEKQELLEIASVAERLRRVSREMDRQRQFLELSSQIQQQVRFNIEKSQRQYFLQEQMKAIRKELGEEDERTAELDELRRGIAESGMPQAVRTEAQRELDRLTRIPQTSPEHTVIRTYLDWMLEIPWGVVTPDNLDINGAERILDEDHYGLEKVKKRILEYLAVRKLAPESRGPILCFLGPPGVGKTSLGRSIARALGRHFIRMSLGGIRDEAELRGHRRTYIGAMPGRVAQEIRRAGSMNPVFMLDELDKIGQDFRGDPASVLLEVLDPAQNDTFRDLYLNVPLDLSRVLFIGTANYMGPVPPALRDRMEVIELPGYTPAEKARIARRYLLPRQMKDNGLTPRRIKLTDAAIDAVITGYTREAGVRELERRIGAICRGVAALVAKGAARHRTVDARQVGEYLGAAQYESEVAQRTSVPGVATGLFYTPAGGGVLFIEATRYPGRGHLTLTGQIGDVMRESAHAAFSLVKSWSRPLRISMDELVRMDVHVHVPAGAVPKDGPSAGLAIVTALVSLLRNRPVHPDVAMTGEITLRGLVLPVGGIKQKVLAARAAGIRTVILPQRNRKDFDELTAEARRGLKFVFAEKVEQALRAAIDTAPARGRKRPPARTKAPPGK